MITILMAAYNGEKYIGEQIGSVLGQTVEGMKLHIRDDCSVDGTWDILSRYGRKYPGVIEISRTAGNTGSPKHNFFGMMSSIQDDYIMLCDHDDIWMADKTERTLGKMRGLEREHGKNTPLLVHTDLCVVDERLGLVYPSFKRAMNGDWRKTRLNSLIVQNILTGCTCMYNRALAELVAAPILSAGGGGYNTPYMVMHDWWLGLVAGAFGHIGHIDEPTVLYRQHGGNAIGAKDVRSLRYMAGRLAGYREIKAALDETYRQAESFLLVYRDKLLSGQIELLEEYIGIRGKSKSRRLRSAIKLGTLKSGVLRKAAQMIFI